MTPNQIIRDRNQGPAKLSQKLQSKKRQSGSVVSNTMHDSRGFPDIFKRKANVRNFAGLYNPRQESDSLVFMKEKYRIGDGEKSQASKNIERKVRMHQ